MFRTSKGSPMTVSPVTHIHHDTCPVSVWRDDTAAPVVGLEVRFPGLVGDDPVYIPLEVAGEVAAAILATLSN